MIVCNESFLFKRMQKPPATDKSQLPSVDKAYVKKHKINDLLNELYLSIVSEKPDNPIEFVIKRLETKLPPEIKRKSSISIPVINQEKPEDATAKMFGKLNLQNLLAPPTADLTPNLSSNRLNESVSGSIGGGGNTDILGSFAFKKLQILDRMNRILVNKSKELNEDEILKKEEITVFTREYEDFDKPDELRTVDLNYIEDTLNKQHETLQNKKIEMSQVIQQEILEKKQKVAAGVVEGRKKTDAVDESISQTGGGLVDEPQIEDEIYNKDIVHEDKSKKNKGARRMKSTYGGWNETQTIQLVVCQNCAKIQDTIRFNDNTMSMRTTQYLSMDPMNKNIKARMSEPAVKSLMINEDENIIKAEKVELNSKKPLEQKIEITSTPLDKMFESLPEQKVETKKLESFNVDKSDLKIDDLKTDDADDDNIESASQVSGPRGPIARFEAPTTRSINQDNTYQQASSRSGGILAWVLARQAQTQEQLDLTMNDVNISKASKSNSTLKNESKLPTSKPSSVVKEVSKTPSVVKDNTLDEENNQLWKQAYDSGSDTSKSSRRTLRSTSSTAKKNNYFKLE